MSLAARGVTGVLMRRYTGVRAARISVEIRIVPGAEGLTISEGSTGVTVGKGEAALHLAACLTGARMEGTTW